MYGGWQPIGLIICLKWFANAMIVPPLLEAFVVFKNLEDRHFNGLYINSPLSHVIAAHAECPLNVGDFDPVLKLKRYQRGKKPVCCRCSHVNYICQTNHIVTFTVNRSNTIKLLCKMIELVTNPVICEKRGRKEEDG